MTVAQLQRLIRQSGLRPQQAAGQNFLLDESVVESMVAAAGIEEGDTVLEIGPGFGVLTAAVLETGAKVVSVELDDRLFAYMRQHFGQRKNLTLVHDDIFRVRLDQYVKDDGYKVVANLPYSATSLVFRNFLSLAPRPTSMTVMVQREVAKRICAAPGDMSVLAFMVQYYSQPTLLFDVPPHSFYPAPKVSSSVVHLENLKTLQQDVDKPLFHLVKCGFSSRRKKLSNALSASMKIPVLEIESKMAKVSLKENIRAQELSVQDWLDLKQQFS